MIRSSLPNTKSATFAGLVPHPDARLQGFPTPHGTGFFVSKDGYFITARHVLEKESVNKTLYNFSEIFLTKPEQLAWDVSNLSIVKDWPKWDLALLKADWEKSKSNAAFRGKDGFDFLEIDFSVVPEGTQVYAFGYPLPDIRVVGNQRMMIGFHYFCPRATSAMISSHDYIIGTLRGRLSFPEYYVIDKALNPGNSGGPIVGGETGKAIAVCQALQKFRLPQESGVEVEVPSLYGIAVSLKNIENDLRQFL